MNVQFRWDFWTLLSWEFSDLRFPYIMSTLQTSFKPLLPKEWGRGGGSKIHISRGDCEYQGRNLCRLLSQLRLRIRPQLALQTRYKVKHACEASRDMTRFGWNILPQNWEGDFSMKARRTLCGGGGHEGSNRREIITVRGQSYVSRLPKYWPPHPLLRPASVSSPRKLAGRRGGWGVNILEDERHRIALLQ